MTTVLIRRNAPTDGCHNLTALMPRCTKTSFLLTPHYICAHRNSDNLHNAVFIGYSLVGRTPYCGLTSDHLPVPVACDRCQSSASVVAGQTGAPCSQSLATYTDSGPSTDLCRGKTMVKTSAISYDSTWLSKSAVPRISFQYTCIYISIRQL